MSSVSDFIIKNGWLKEYVGPGGDVVIPQGVTRIGNRAFCDCTSLRSVTIPDSVTTISGSAFSGCMSLTSVTIPGSVKSLSDSIFSGCMSLTSVTIPDSVTSISDRMFSGCGSITSIKIPGSVTHIGERAFEGCHSLTSITIPDALASIGSEAFKDCGGLVSIVVPEGVTSIGDEAFKDCSSLKSITLPESMLEYGESLFRGCSCVVFLSKCTKGLSRAIEGCPHTKLHISGTITAVPANLRVHAVLGFVAESGEDPNSERSKSYRDYMSKNAGKLCEVAFEHPQLLHYLCGQKLIKAKDYDIYIECAARRGNAEQKALLLAYRELLGGKELVRAQKKKAAAIEAYEKAAAERIAARDPAQGISGITFAITGNLSFWESRKQVEEYLDSYGAKISPSITKKVDYLVTNDTDSGSEKNRKAAELGVQIISEEEFNEMVGRRFQNKPIVEVPTWMKAIPDRALAECDYLTSITIPDRVTSIGSFAFYGCRSLTSVTIPKGVTNINLAAFEGCSSLTSASIPESVTSIGDEAFSGCSSLTRITIPKGVTSIARAAFRECSNLINIVIPERVTRIGDAAFWCCSSLSSVTIPESVTEIGSGAFGSCVSLADMTIPKSVSSIDSRAFGGCEGLTIHTPAGSYAEQYAKEHKIKVVND